jgi:hypothetical protein
MQFSENIANRAMGELTLSIATDLAIQSALGIHPEIQVKSAPVLEYTELWINIRTLFRNFMGSLDKGGANGGLPPQYAAAITSEMEMIASLIRDHTRGRTKVVYYLSNYNGIEQKYRLVGVVRKDNTPKQLEYTALAKETIGIMLKEKHFDIKGFDLMLKPEDGAARPDIMILTNYAYDLLSHKYFGHMVLLESHTGAIKEKAQWYTKYLNGKTLSMIPFREDFIQVFGDSETFRPGNPKLKEALVEVATKYNWTAVTTLDKIRYGINSIQNPYAKELLLSILVH